MERTTIISKSTLQPFFLLVNESSKELEGLSDRVHYSLVDILSVLERLQEVKLLIRIW